MRNQKENTIDLIKRKYKVNFLMSVPIYIDELLKKEVAENDTSKTSIINGLLEQRAEKK
jgi:hypothetical protein